MLDEINILAEIKSNHYKRTYLVEKSGENFLLEKIKINDRSYLEKVEEVIKKIQDLKIKVFVEIIDFDRDDNYFYIRKKIYKNSRSIKSILEDEELSNDKVKKIAITLCNIAEYFHKNNILFLNFNPDNVYFDENDSILVDDFGMLEKNLAKLSGIKDLKNAIAEHIYIAPEVWNDKACVASDFYSIGILISVLLYKGITEKFSYKKLPVNLKKYGVKDFNLNEFVAKSTQYFDDNRIRTFDECKKSLTQLEPQVKGVAISKGRIILLGITSVITLFLILSVFLMIVNKYSVKELFVNYQLFFGIRSEKFMKKFEQQIAVKIEQRLKAQQEKMNKYLIIKSVPEKAIVSINDEPLGLTPLTLGMKVTDANFKLKLEKIGFDVWEKYIKLKDKKTNRIYIKLTKNLFINTMAAHEDEITGISFSFDDKYLATSGKDEVVNIFDTGTWEKITSFRNIKYNPYSVVFSPVKELLVIGSGDGFLSFYDTKNWFKLNKFKAHDSPVFALKFTPDSKYIISGGVDNYIKIWTADDGDLEYKIDKAHKDVIKNISFSPDRKFFATASLDGKVKVWRNEMWALVKELDFEAPVFSASFNFNNLLAVGGSAHGKNKISLIIYNTITWEKNKEIAFNKNDVRFVRFSPDGNFLAVAVQNNIYIYSVKEWKIITVLKKHESNIKLLDFSYNGKYLVSGDEDGVIVVWDSLGLNILE